MTMPMDRMKEGWRRQCVESAADAQMRTPFRNWVIGWWDLYSRWKDLHGSCGWDPARIKAKYAKGFKP